MLIFPMSQESMPAVSELLSAKFDEGVSFSMKISIYKLFLVILLSAMMRSPLYAGNGIHISIIEGELPPEEKIHLIKLPPVVLDKNEKPTLPESPVTGRQVIPPPAGIGNQGPAIEQFIKKQKVADDNVKKEKDKPVQAQVISTGNHLRSEVDQGNNHSTLLGIQKSELKPQRPETDSRPSVPDRPLRPEKPDVSDLPERPEIPDRPERPVRPNRPDRPDRPELPARPDRPGR
ncbi:MAG: hypothetical protein K9K86_09915 [Pseudomonadales bacterium]|nr:hypothetical protein [Pseudomonadales bacterium]